MTDMDPLLTVAMVLVWSGCLLGCATSILSVILACTHVTWDDALLSCVTCVFDWIHLVDLQMRCEDIV